jgi:hypothetical protein
MKMLGMFFTLCVGLAVLQAAIKAIFLACLGAVLISALLQPLETLAGLATVMLMGLVMTYPLVGLPLLVALAIWGRASN